MNKVPLMDGQGMLEDEILDRDVFSLSSGLVGIGMSLHVKYCPKIVGLLGWFQQE